MKSVSCSTPLPLISLIFLLFSLASLTSALPRVSFFLPPSSIPIAPETVEGQSHPFFSILSYFTPLQGSNEESELKPKAPAPACTSIECPPYQSIHEESDFEIRRYREAVWTETEPLLAVSFDKATAKGFHRLFQYIEGDNDDAVHIPMTAPVLTSIKPSGGPFCSSTFTVNFLLPQKFWSAPPPPKSELKLRSQKIPSRCVAVRKFSGFATDFNVAQEAKRLADSLERTKWVNVTAPGRRGGSEDELYAIAQYNSPFEVFTKRVNEVWVPFETTGDPEACLPRAAA